MSDANEYQPRTVRRLVEILKSQGVNPRSWQAEAAATLDRLTYRAERAEAELAALDKSHTDLGRKLAEAGREIERLRK